MQKTIDVMMEKGLKQNAESLLASKGFFNPNWTEQKVIDAVTTAYNEALRKGVPSGTFRYSTTVFGEKITLNFNNKVFTSAWGHIKLTLSDFGY